MPLKEVRKRFIVFWLNNSNILTGFEVISEGLLNRSFSTSARSLQRAIVATCANPISTNNNPSDNMTASREDINITNQFIEAGKIISIKVLDHINFCCNTYMSYASKRKKQQIYLFFLKP